jgi:AraC family transcriptional activator of tynA and feaB
MTAVSGTIEVDGPVTPERRREWSRAYASSKIADFAVIPKHATSFHGRLRTRSLQDLLLIDVEADPFVTRWGTGSPAARYIGISANTLPFPERVVLGQRTELLAERPVDVWDGGMLVEAETLAPMAQTMLLVPKRALHMGEDAPLVLDDVIDDRDAGSLRLLRSVLLAVAEEADGLGPLAAIAARNAIVDLLLSIGQDRKPQAGAAVSESMRVSVLRWIDDHLHLGQIPPAKAAEQHGISVRSLHRLFADTGESFGALIRRRRLERARADLLRSDDMVLSIAMRWGYADASHFIAEFRRVHGTTPAAYRRENCPLR